MTLARFCQTYLRWILIFFLSSILSFCLNKTSNRSTTNSGDLKDKSDTTSRSDNNSENTSAFIVDYGIYTTTGNKKIVSADSPVGEITSIKNSAIISQTDEIIAKKGLVFGFRYSFSNFPESDTTPRVKIRVLHPELKNPKTGVNSSESSWTDTAFTSATDQNTAGWVFEHDWEMVAGEWTIQVYYNEVLMTEQSFNVSVNDG